MEQTDLIRESELRLINDILKSGKDVRIQNTKKGCRIVSDTVTVLKRIETEDPGVAPAAGRRVPRLPMRN